MGYHSAPVQPRPQRLGGIAGVIVVAALIGTSGVAIAVSPTTPADKPSAAGYDPADIPPPATDITTAPTLPIPQPMPSATPATTTVTVPGPAGPTVYRTVHDTATVTATVTVTTTETVTATVTVTETVTPPAPTTTVEPTASATRGKP